MAGSPVIPRRRTGPPGVIAGAVALALAVSACGGAGGAARRSGTFSGVFTGVVAPGVGNCIDTGGQPKCFTRPVGRPGRCVSVATHNFRSGTDLPATVADCPDCWPVVGVTTPTPQAAAADCR